MKLICLILAVAPLCILAQKPAKGSNTIILSGISKADLKSRLVGEGFTVVDHDSLSFETLPRQYKEIEHGSVILKATQKDSAIYITCFYNQVANETVGNPYGNRWRQAAYTALWGNSKGAFEIADKATVGAGQISYAKLYPQSVPPYHPHSRVRVRSSAIQRRS